MNLVFDNHFARQAPSKLPSILIALAVHAIILGLAMQARHIITLPKPPVVTLKDTTEKPRDEIKPEVIKDAAKKDPDPIFVAPPEISVEKPPRDSVTDITYVKPTIKLGEPSDIGGDLVIGAGTNHTPIHVAANVDAKACDKPTYPASSIRLGEEGTVNLAMLIGADGRVLESRIESSSGSRALDKAAIQGLSLCKFSPGTVDGVPEKSWAKLQYVWNIN